MRPTRQGSTLLTTLSLIGVGLILLLTLVGASFSQIRWGTRLSHNMRAQQAAESVLALATERLITEPDFVRGDSNFFQWSEGESEAWLSFDTTQAEDWSIPASVDNLEGTVQIDGWDGVVLPRRAVQLVAVGESGGRRKIVDVVVQIPEFPFAVASSGPIESNGGLLIGGLESDTVDPSSLSDLGPADLHSNESENAVRLDGEIEIKGDVKAVGGITLGEDVKIRGIVENNAEPLSLSHLDITSLRPGFSTALEPTSGHTKLDGLYHYNQPSLNLSRGLELDNGLLYVNGDLTITGGVSGQGAIIVNGNVEIYDGAALSADNELALVASGDVVIDGRGEASYFQGLIYTEGDLSAKDITLLGSFVANRDNAVDPGSRINIEDATVIHHPGSAHFDFPDEGFSWLAGGGGTEVMYSLTVSGEYFETMKELLRDKRPADPEWQASLQEVADNSELRSVPWENGAPTESDPEKWRLRTTAEIKALIPGQIDSVSGFNTVHHGGGTPKKKKLAYGSDTIGFSFDLNKFLPPESSMRIVSWRRQ